MARHAQHRAFSLKADNFNLTNYHTFQPLLRATMRQLDSMAPRFEIQGSQIEILDHPADFYSVLKQKIINAHSRVFLSSLYIGRYQHELVDCIGAAMKKTPTLKVDILLDCLRSTRDSPGDSTASLLAPLVSQFGDRIEVRFYHTPKLHGFAKMLVPKRFNEGFGLQHMKIYGFDDEVMLSGANLSEDYFTNRQDRYYLFRSKSISDYYHTVQSTVGSLSYRVVPSDDIQKYALQWPSTNRASEPLLNVERYVKDCNRVLYPVLKGHCGSENAVQVTNPDTVVYAVSSFSPLLNPDFSTEKPAILRILSFLDEQRASFTFTAGYFNMHKDILNKICHSLASGRIITASPFANSFYKSKGVSKYVPDAYLYNAGKFLKTVTKNHREDVVKLLEWQRGIIRQPNGWSYHAKGIWINLPDEAEPSITVIGSSNYTKRAYSLDLETNAIVITKDPELKSRMKQEVDHLCKHTTTLTLADFKKPERRISPGVKAASMILSNML
ncbi:DEKNAAC103569 [Brettanomyces naardenensis]|uniref:CDP-diacylglycerol--glycerol-3-phosphate 3-phosphatidyltransferase n=1 Tax=Brettanomyces naardenensis TaxID=13370 RepID=A0A448YMX1_BRENA|nr:DEKNAAC103569 [Brettanomyces naardenensis]